VSELSCVFEEEMTNLDLHSACRAGIGRQTAVAFAKHGITRLAVADINKVQLDASIADLKKLYPAIQVLPLQLDVRDNEQVRRGIAETAKAFGRLDVAVNNAGIAATGRLTHETEDEEIERVLDVNLRGVYRCQKAELALMVKQEYAHGPWRHSRLGLRES
jgi:NAD(P)-dependent dehydrogenase (short-subunit alcohol dehydrogenase family)